MVLQSFDSFKIDGSVSNWNPVFADDSQGSAYYMPQQINGTAIIDGGSGLYRTAEFQSDGVAMTGIVNGFVYMPTLVEPSLTPFYSQSYGISGSGLYMVSVKTGQEIRLYTSGIAGSAYIRGISVIKESDTKLQVMVTSQYEPIGYNVNSANRQQYTITKDFFENGIKFRNKIGYCYSPNYGTAFTCKMNLNGQITKF